MQSILILNCPEIYRKFHQPLEYLAFKHSLRYLDFEDMYDWVIKTAMSNILSLKVKGHVRNLIGHDVMNEIYSEIGQRLEYELLQFIQSQRVQFLQNETIRMLVTQNDMVIVRSL